MKKLFFIFILLFLQASQLFASPVNSLKERARNGDAQAAYDLGLYYSDENSAEQNWDYAVYWFFHASLKGHQKSQVALSLLMKQGLGLPKNEEESKRWLEKAANSGFTPAQVRVAENYERGDGTLRDVQKAIDWYTNAADRGDPEAQTTLCRFYELGEGVEKDLSTAMKLCRIAATNGFAPAQYHLGRLYLERFRDPGDFKMAIHWLRQSADQGFLDAQTHLATFYREGIGVKRDYNTAKHLLTEAAGSGNVRAAYDLGNLILDFGPQDAQSSKEAFDWLEIAAEGGHSNASMKLAGLYKRGGRVLQNPVLAAEWRRHGEQQEPSKALGPTPDEIVRELGPRATRALIKKMEPAEKTEGQRVAQQGKLKANLSGYQQGQQVRKQVLTVLSLLNNLKKKGGFFALQAFRNQAALARTSFQTGHDDLGLHILSSLAPQLEIYISRISAQLASRMEIPESSMTPMEMENLHEIWKEELGVYRDQALGGLRVLLQVSEIFLTAGRYRRALRTAKSCRPVEEKRIHRVFWDEDHYLNRVSRELLGRPLEPPDFFDEAESLIDKILQIYPGSIASRD